MDQHTRLPFPLLSPGVCSNSCPLSQWCFLTISSSAVLVSFCLQPFLASGSFPISQLFASGRLKYWNFSIRPSNEYSGLISFRIDWFDLYPWVIMVWSWKFPYPGKISKMVFTYGLSLHANYYHLNNAWLIWIGFLVRLSVQLLFPLYNK